MLTKADISLVRSLADKRSREEHGLFVVEGRKMVGEALASRFRVERAFATAEAAEEVVGGARAGAENGLRTATVRSLRPSPVRSPQPALAATPEVTIVSDKEMERLSLLKTPSDALALVAIERPPLPAPAASTALILALDDVQDPGNVGTIIRLADWFGIEDVVCSPASADCYSPKVVQSTMGAIFRVRVHYIPLAQWLAEQRAPVFGTFMEGENIYAAQLPAAGIVVMGNEGRGITPAVEAAVTRRLAIPPFLAAREGGSEGVGRGSESLNVAIATAIVCSEFRRRM